ncbi:MAG: hypothetical protein AB7Y74_06865 [Syntrophorhabdus sp.]
MTEMKMNGAHKISRKLRKYRWIAYSLLIPLLFSFYVDFKMSSPCKAVQSGAKQSLGKIAKLQEVYHSEYGSYSESIEEIGFRINPESGHGNRYAYEIHVSPDMESYCVIAYSIEGIGRGKNFDAWTLDHNLILKNVVEGCNDSENKMTYLDLSMYIILITIIADVILSILLFPLKKYKKAIYISVFTIVFGAFFYVNLPRLI